MAIVANKAHMTQFVDQPFCSPNRSNVGEPNGVLTPQYSGEIVLDTTNNCMWKAMTVANNSWVAITAPN